MICIFYSVAAVKCFFANDAYFLALARHERAIKSRVRLISGRAALIANSLLTRASRK